MAVHFHANQYEAAYKPTVLRNWEVPKYYCGKTHQRKGRTQIISNDRGHLLPGVPKSQASPWGNFMSTWHLPKKIDRKTANVLNGTEPPLPRCECVKKKAKKTPKFNEEKLITSPEPEEEDIKGKPVGNGCQCWQKATKTSLVGEIGDDSGGVGEISPKPSQTPEKDVNKENVSNNAYPYVPGDLTEEKHQLQSYENLAANRFGSKNPQNASKGYPKNRDDFSKPLPKIEKSLSKENGEMLEMDRRKISGGKKITSPLLAAISNFNLAKRLHKENLEHDPLPDTITNSMYCKLQMQRSEHDPGLALEEENFASGVGWKGYPGYGPTRCTKLKVYRPKTCQNFQNKNVDNARPSSVSSFDKKWRFLRQRKVSPIELAICWDLTPENPKDEPKRSTHIDGSNGSAAPAVFSLVSTPKEEETKIEEKRDGLNSRCPIFKRVPVKTLEERDFVLDRPKTSLPQRRISQDSSDKSEKYLKNRAKSAYNLNEEKNVDCVLHQSTPDLSDGCKKRRSNPRLCMACEMKNVSIKDKKPKSDFKLAFKAGVPKKCVSSFSWCRRDRFKFEVPKQKDPYSPKNYAIRSLAPPFSLQKDNRQEYPEHWRLATVYQHSYKPIQSRKRPLLATVFK